MLHHVKWWAKTATEKDDQIQWQSSTPTEAIQPLHLNQWRPMVLNYQFTLKEFFQECLKLSFTPGHKHFLTLQTHAKGE